MKSRSVPAIMKSIFSAVRLIFLSGILMAVALGQAPPNTKTTLSPEEQELLRARKANEEAQADYYREQTNKLRQPPPTASPTPGSFSQSVAENPASVIGVIGSILGAVILAFVGLTTLYFNSRNALKAERDIQFYEAMKRLGDKDSPMLRSSAAGLLALMAQVEWRELSLSRKWPLIKPVRSHPYFATAVDQLLTGLLLENNLAVIESIKDALQQLIPRDNGTIIRRLYTANVSFQDEFASQMAEFFVISNCQVPPDPNDNAHSAELWKQLEYLSMGYSDQVLRILVSRSVTFRSRFENYLTIFKTQTTGDRGQLLSAIHDNLRIASNRLRANVTLFCTALPRIRLQDTRDAPYPYLFSFPRLFLVGGSIEAEADLSSINFANSNFQGINFGKANLENSNFAFANLVVYMSGGNLRKAFLREAQLQGAWLAGVDMSDATLGDAKINSWTTLNGCNWWKANFYTSNPDPEVDSDLLEKLFERYRDDVPTDLDEVHASVRAFLESKQVKRAPEQSS